MLRVLGAPPHIPPVAGHRPAGRFFGLRKLAVPPVWLVSSATTSARQLSTRLGPEYVGKLLSLAAWLLACCYLMAPVRASAISGAGLARIHHALRDSDLRVRVQALIVLARLKDKRSLAPIVRVLLRDRSTSCRALAAAALGAIGDPRGISALRRRLSDPSERVRQQVKLALARLARARPPSKAGLSRRRVVLRLGAMGAKTREGRRVKRRLRPAWIAQVSKSRSVGLLGQRQRPSSQQKVFKVNSSITRFQRVRQGRTVRTTCTVSVVLEHHGSIVMMTSGGATVEVSAQTFRRAHAAQVDQRVVETAVASAHQNLERYLRRY
ncbi:MAG: hypothetical protein CSA65_04655 [Proteobacteria bacterium]|nr:MAG: hypothetical protein CSB49_02885 [Pseudomonadota bacterium]PIE18578.1 MAG: hypothetical protein CSA65_04655 [Pseudomonadota bacterium]